MAGNEGTRRIIVGITGASGAIYGIELLKVLRTAGVESHLIITDAAARTIPLETDYTIPDVQALATGSYEEGDISAPVASGSFLTHGMVVAPCSMKSLSAIANSYAENLLVRAADVCLKEGRKLILLVRETPLHRGHLRLMSMAAELGAIILPPIPAFYHRPQSIQEIVHQTVGKTLDQLGIEHELYRRWGEPG